MYQGKKCLGVITARGGSKGIPRKNIKEIADKPLIAYTIEAAQQSTFLDTCVVSTEDAEIARVAKEYGALVPFMRPPELATDSAKSIPVIQHALRFFEEQQGVSFDYVMILQPTSPLRTAADIDACIKIAIEKNADSVMSMYTLSDFSLPKLKRIDSEGLIHTYLEEHTEGNESAARTATGPLYKRNCAVYLTRVSSIMKGDLFGERSYAYCMPEERSVDINTMYDWIVAEALLKRTVESV